MRRTPCARAVYVSTAGVGSYGATPVVMGVDTMFKPWYFTGRVVLWGRLYPTRSSAMDAAAHMASTFT